MPALDVVSEDLELLGLARMPPTLVALTVAYRMAIRRAFYKSGDFAAAPALEAAYYRLLERV